MDYQICTRCVMDTTDPDITFNEQGECSNCTSYYAKVRERVFSGAEGKKRLTSFIEVIQSKGKDKKYDCIVGLSGGVDSTYLAYIAVKELGLRPLAVHLDNGWNSRTATKNIHRIVRKLGIDLYTHVIDWEEFKDLQRSYLKASVIDIEALTDHAIKATVYNAAKREGIKYILSGVNLVTEGILPMQWRYNKSDAKNIVAIHKQFGTRPLKTFPLYTLPKRIAYQSFSGIREIEVLNYIDYTKETAKKIISEELGWEDYGSKHGESTFTRFYQHYILPKKFNVDKRRAHLSALICANEISREEAIKQLQNPPEEPAKLQHEKEYVIRKLGFTEEEFDTILQEPVKSHHDYPNNDKLFRTLRKVYLKFLKK